MSTSPRLRFGLLGLAAFLVMVAEIAAIVWVASEIGWWTLALLLATSFLGMLLMQREWRREWDALVRALVSGELPAGRMADATLVLLGGVLLLLPGFLTDIVGLVLLIPFSRRFVRSALAWAISRVVKSRAGGSTVIRGEATVVEPAGIENATEGQTLRGEVVEDPSV